MCRLLDKIPYMYLKPSLSLREVWRGEKMSEEPMRGIVLPVTYGSEARVMYPRKRSRMKAVEMRSLRVMYGVTKFATIRKGLRSR